MLCAVVLLRCCGHVPNHEIISSMPLFKFQAMFKESVQKATSGFSIPSENELYGARGNRTWRNTTEFERKRAPPPVSDHHDPVHWRAWKMLRKVRSGIHLLSI